MDTRAKRVRLRVGALVPEDQEQTYTIELRGSAVGIAFVRSALIKAAAQSKNLKPEKGRKCGSGS